MESAEAVIEPKASPGESLERDRERRREKGRLMLSKVKRKKIRKAEVLKEEVEEALVLHYF